MLVELKSKVFSDKVLTTLTQLIETELKKIVGRVQVLVDFHRNTGWATINHNYFRKIHVKSGSLLAHFHRLIDCVVVVFSPPGI